MSNLHSWNRKVKDKLTGMSDQREPSLCCEGAETLATTAAEVMVKEPLMLMAYCNNILQLYSKRLSW